MSNNPYAPPDSELSNPPEDSVRQRFPFWVIGPLPWVVAAVLAITIDASRYRFFSPTELLLIHIGISSVFASVFAGTYGLIYGLILWRVCRALYVTPRAKPHFWTIQAVVVIGNFLQFPGPMTFLFATLSGGLMAIFNFQENVQSKN